MKAVRFRFRTDVEAADLFAVGADEPGNEGRVGRSLQMGDERPIFAADEFLDFQFAVANETQGDGLDPAGRAGARQFAPKHGRQIEPDEIIERPAREIGIDERFVDAARVLHRLVDRRLGDRIEDDAFDRLVLEDASWPSGLRERARKSLRLRDQGRSRE